MAAQHTAPQIPEGEVKLAQGIAHFLEGVGEHLHRDGLRDTPRRYAKSLAEMTAGYDSDPADILNRIFRTTNDQMVIVRDIEFTSLCEHHILPFFGTAHVGYLPKEGRIVGLSKIPRMVQAFAMRLQTQEHLTQQIAAALMEHKSLQPGGVGVILKGTHLCLRHRGARQPRAEMVTSCLLGSFRGMETRSEFFAFVGNEI